MSYIIKLYNLLKLNDFVYVRDPLDHLAHKENVVKQGHQVLLDRVVIQERKVKKEHQEQLVTQDHRVIRV